MKAVESLIHQYKPLFEKGGRFEKAWPVFELAETFFLTPDTATSKGPHVRDPIDLKRVMIFVIYALLPATLMGWYNVGHQAYLAEGVQAGLMDCMVRGGWHMLPIIITSYAVGGFAEMVFAMVRGHEISEGFLVTGLLFPLTLPPTIPLWMVAMGVTFGVVIGKEVFGGVGMNVLNPALTARAFVFFTYPAFISGTGVWDASGRGPWAAAQIDAYTGATPLLVVASGERGQQAVELLDAAHWSWMDMFLGNIPGSMGEVSAAGALLGGLFLIVTGIASWRVMAGCVAGLFGIAAIFNGFAGADALPLMTLPPHYHLVMGGFAFGMVFMATDPVSSAATPIGQLIYGVGIGVLCGLVRVVNPAYPEGMMLAILFMNVFAPLVDYYVVRGTVRRRAARMAAA